MRNTEKARQWLKRARSNLARAKTGRASQDILLEDLCFDAQQAVEKALKSLCVLHEIVFTKTHSISYLVELLEKHHIKVPEEVHKANVLTGYAVESRYPGEYEPIDEDDYKEAIGIAEEVVHWVENLIEREK